MKSLKKNNLLIIILFVITILMSVGFAIISTTLNINGQSTIKKQTWDIHFENVSITNNSVTAIKDAVIANDAATLVEYEIELSKPGDFYEFTVDVVNEGTLDSLIEMISLTGVEEHEDYLTYQATYLNGEEIKIGDALNSETSETYKVRVEYKKDLESLPSEDIKLNLVFAVTYSQGRGGEVITNYYTLTGIVYDTEGQPMTSGEVEVHSKIIKAPINSDGTYILKNVPVGNHEIFVKNETGEVVKEDTFTLSSGETTTTNDNEIVISNDIQPEINILVTKGVEITLELPKHTINIISENGETKELKVTKGENGKISILPNIGYQYLSMTCTTDEDIKYNPETKEVEINNINENTTCNVVFEKMEGYDEGPVVTLSQNGTSEYQKEVSTKVEVETKVGSIKEDTIKYIVSEDKEAKVTKELTNGQTITIENVTGQYYVIVEACNNINICNRFVSEPYYLDNELPSITYSQNGNENYEQKVTTTIEVNDTNSGIENETLKYILTTDKEAEPNISIENGKELTLESLTGEYYVIVKVCDKVGNCKKEISEVYHLDNELPNIVYSQNGNREYAKSHETKVEVSDNHNDIETIKYVVTTNKEDIPTEEIANGATIKLENISGTYYVIVEACDKAGNCKKEVSNLFNLDNKKPSITIDTNGNSTYVKNVSTKIEVKDEQNNLDESTLKYIITTDKEATPNKVLTNGDIITIENVTGVHYIIVEACDTLGHCEKVVSNEYYLDNELPSITYSQNGNDAYTKSASTKVNVENEDGKINTIKYAISKDTNAEATEEITNGGTVNLNGLSGVYYVVVEACDVAGNCQKTSSNAFYLDNELPSITIGTNGNSTYVKSVSTKITVNDNQNNLDENTLKYIITTDKEATPDKVLLNGATITIENVTGIHYIIVEACDKTGNCQKIVSNPYYLDNTAPTIVYGTNGNSTYAKSYSTTVTATDSHSQLNTLKYITGTSSTATPTTDIASGGTITISSVTGGYYVVTKACDKAGNCATLASNVFKMDNTAPTIVYGTNGASTYGKSYSTKVTASDSHSTLNTLKYITGTSSTATPTTSLTNGGTVTISSVTGDYYVVSEACDKAGNCTTLASNVFKMDNSAPTITYGTNGASTYTKNASTKVTVNANTGEINTIKYIVSTDKTATPSTDIASGGTVSLNGLTGDYYVIVKACDKAGNCTTLSSNVFKMDNTAPTIVYGTNGNSTYAKSRSTTVTASDAHSALNTLKYITSTSSSATPSTALTNGGTVTISGVTGNYYVVAQACDKAGNCATLASNVFKMDNTAPTITYGTNGNSTYAKSYSTKVTASDSHSQLNTLKYITGTSNIATPSTTLTSGGTVTISSVTGDYYVVTQACDKAGNCATLASNVFKMDNTAPTIVYGTNGNSTYAKSRSTTVTASDSHSQVNTLKYITSTSKTATPSTTLTNGGTATVSGVTGDYYVVSQACDKAGNCTTLASNVFKMDNTKPTVTATVSGDSVVITMNDAIGLSGYQVTKSSSATSYTAISGTSQTITYTAEEAGIYYVHVKDTSGNTASTTFEIESSALCPYEIGQKISFEHTGDIQTFTAQCNGIYKLESWGGQGGGTNGGKGGYSTGIVSLTKDDSVYVAVGGSGACAAGSESAAGGFNGGGDSKSRGSGYTMCSGGGASHIALTNLGVLSNYKDFKSALLVVAGGGGGAGSASRNSSSGGAGGGLSGVVPANSCSDCGTRTAGSQTAGGTGRAGTGSFGQGRGSLTSPCCGGGGGLYGGAGDTYEWGASGGSGYVGDVTNGETIAGNKEMPTYDGTSTMTGNAGNGYVVITYMAEVEIANGYAWEYACGGAGKEFIAPYDGTYKLEVWGAQGGSGAGRSAKSENYSAAGGKGGYSTGTIELSKNESLYVVVGCAGQDKVYSGTGVGGYNGGGTASGMSSAYGNNGSGGTGGGATHIGTFNSTLAAHGSTSGLYIVAGGGGGGYARGHTTSGGWTYAGGAGGGLIGGPSDEYGGTQTSAGSGGSFGQGGSCSNEGAGGGGGLYGGKAATYSIAGGGSGYIGGVTSGQTIAGDASMPTHDGTGTMTGNEGNGYAKITLIEQN